MLSVKDTLRSDAQIFVQLNDGMNGEELESLMNRIENAYSVQATFSSKEDELEKMKEYYGDDSSFLSLYEEENPLKDALLISTANTSNIQEIKEKIEDMENVYSVTYGGAEATSVLNDINNATIAILGIFIVVFITALSAIYHFIKISVYGKKEMVEGELELTTQPRKIQSYFAIESIVYHVISCILPTLLLGAGYSFIYYHQSRTIFNISLQSPVVIIGITFAFLFVLSILVGGCSGYFISGRLIKKLKK